MAGPMVYPQSDLEIGLGLSRSPDSIMQSSGLNNIIPSSADIMAIRNASLKRMSDVTNQAYSGVSAPQPTALQPTAMPQASQASQMYAQTRAQLEPATPGADTPPPDQNVAAIYDPASKKMYAGGMAFDSQDVSSAIQASQLIGQPNTPPPTNFSGGQKLSADAYRQYMDSLGANRGFGGNFMQGVQNTAGALVGGTGRVLETTGIAPNAG